jgi:phenylpropionate dioxygenase-like ring-hydroxylating dioxygenase large terminal subunit
MLKNLWYAAAFEADVPRDKPLGVRRLGHDLVLFRDDAGEIACLANACVHRGGALDRGFLEEGGLACPYHGWRYDAKGVCRAIPSLGPEAEIPKRARVDRYPVAVKYGIVFVYLGEEDETTRLAIPDFLPEYGQADFRFISGTFDYAANWIRVLENHIDSSHTHFVHPEFGNREAPRPRQGPVEHTASGAFAFNRYRPRSKSGEMAKVVDADRPDIVTRLAWDIGAMCVRLHVQMTETMQQIVFQAFAPIDEFRCVSFYLQGRNFLLSPDSDAPMQRDLERVFAEDAGVLEPLKPVIAPLGATQELSVATDQLSFAFRRKIAALEGRGWRLDPSLDSPRGERDRLTVIPSPARRADPKAWVFQPTPCLAPRATDAAAE